MYPRTRLGESRKQTLDSGRLETIRHQNWVPVAFNRIKKTEFGIWLERRDTHHKRENVCQDEKKKIRRHRTSRGWLEPLLGNFMRVIRIERPRCDRRRTTGPFAGCEWNIFGEDRVKRNQLAGPGDKKPKEARSRGLLRRHDTSDSLKEILTWRETVSDCGIECRYA